MTKWRTRRAMTPLSIHQLTMPRRRFFGRSEIWRDNGTATGDFYVFGIRVVREHWHHSTHLWD